MIAGFFVFGTLSKFTYLLKKLVSNSVSQNRVRNFTHQKSLKPLSGNLFSY